MVFITLVLARNLTISLVPTIFPNGLLSRTPHLLTGRWCPPLLLSLLLMVSGAWAAGFKVVNAATWLDQDVYRLNATIDYQLSPATLDALENGVPLTLQLQMEVLRKRTWLWDETVASLQQRFRLEYHALARQYLVTNLNSGELKSFPTQGTATEFLGRIHNFPLLDSSLLQNGEEYYGRLRASLDIEALPAPLRPLAYLSGKWRLTSEWYVWPL